MKLKIYITLLLLTIITFYSCSRHEDNQDQPGFSISAKLNLPKPTHGMLMTLKGYQEYDIDSFQVDSTGFHFKKILDPSNDNKVYTLSLPEYDYNLNLFVSIGDSIHITSVNPNLSDIKIEGSELHSTIGQYFSLFSNVLAEIDSLQQVIYYYQNSNRANPKFLAEIESQLYKLNDKFYHIDSTYISENIDSRIIPFILFNKYINFNNGIESINQFLTKLPEENKNNFYVQLIYSIEENKLSIGKKFSFEKMPDNNGNVLSLDNVKAKAIIVDFWASWCAPCRKENVQLVHTYKMYKPKGLEIVSISLDSKKESWLKAIEDDKLTWLHVSTLQGWDNPLAKKHFIVSIPYNIILDENHEIIAINKHGEELRAFLKTVL